MTSDAVRELEEKNEALRTRIVTAHAERDSALALVHARTVNLDAMRTDRDAAVKRAEDAEAKLAAVREAQVAAEKAAGVHVEPARHVTAEQAAESLRAEDARRDAVCSPETDWNTLEPYDPPTTSLQAASARTVNPNDGCPFGGCADCPHPGSLQAVIIQRDALRERVRSLERERDARDEDEARDTQLRLEVIAAATPDGEENDHE